MQKILLAIDDAYFGKLICDFVCNHRWEQGTKFRIISVISWLPTENQIQLSKDLQVYADNERSLRLELCKNVRDRLKEFMPESLIEEEILVGKPAEEILVNSASWGADHIILGSHARQGMSLFIMGSVSTAVISHAKCSVTVVKDRA